MVEPPHERGHAHLARPADVAKHSDVFATPVLVPLEMLFHQPWGSDDVVAHEEDERCPRGPPAGVACRRHAGGAPLQYPCRDSSAIWRDRSAYRLRIVIDRVSDDEHLTALQRCGLVLERIDDSREGVTAAIGRNDDRQLHATASSSGSAATPATSIR